jgi:hypothetical protein
MAIGIPTTMIPITSVRLLSFCGFHLIFTIWWQGVGCGTSFWLDLALIPFYYVTHFSLLFLLRYKLRALATLVFREPDPLTLRKKKKELGNVA